MKRNTEVLIRLAIALQKEKSYKYRAENEFYNNDIVLENCIEDVLGYEPPGKDKPFRAYKFIQEEWDGNYNNISKSWKIIIESLFLKP